MDESHSYGILDLPEIMGLDTRESLIRIPPEQDVPLTLRVRKIIDTPEFRRLARISQLGFVSLVYPGARHTRFEHSLGVYRLSLLILKRLAREPDFQRIVRPEEAELMMITALLHDIGHYPFGHLIEILDLPQFPPHEQMAVFFLKNSPIEQILRDDWKVDPDNILELLNETETRRRSREAPEELQRRRKVYRLLMSILSGPVDIDKMDYLFRDSHGAGVPYGRNFDVERLIGSFCLNADQDGLALSAKGKTAAELMVFARYVMFSEVYWHHAVRSATAMFQRAFYLIFNSEGEQTSETVQKFLTGTEDDCIQYLFELCRAPQGNKQVAKDLVMAEQLLYGIFGNQRVLYKQIRQFCIVDDPVLYRRLAGRPYVELLNISFALEQRLGIEPHHLIIDAPPVSKEVEFLIDVYYSRERCYRSLSDVSPVLRALAKEQFDDYVKRVRLFVHPEIKTRISMLENLNNTIMDAIDDCHL